VRGWGEAGGQNPPVRPRPRRHHCGLGLLVYPPCG
jgi:hypothetical protein